MATEYKIDMDDDNDVTVDGQCADEKTSPPSNVLKWKDAGSKKTIVGDRSPTWRSPWHSRRWPHGPLIRATVAATAVHTRARAQAPVHTLPSRSIPRAHSRTTHIPLACMGPDCMFPLYRC